MRRWDKGSLPGKLRWVPGHASPEDAEVFGQVGPFYTAVRAERADRLTRQKPTTVLQASWHVTQHN